MNEHQQIDLAIWEACKEGDKNAYAHIYRLYYPRLFNYGCKFTADAALVEDSIQEIFVRFWANREKLAAVRELKSYLFVSFRHYLLKQLSQQKGQQLDIADNAFDFALELSVEQKKMQTEHMQEQAVILHQALQQLTQRQKEAIFFRFFENMSYEEIADILDISVKATYKLVARAILVLRQCYHNMPLVNMALTVSALAIVLGSLELAEFVGKI